MKRLLFSAFIILLSLNLARLYFSTIDPNSNYEQLFLSQVLDLFSRFQDNWLILVEDLAELAKVIKDSTFQSLYTFSFIPELLSSIFRVVWNILALLGSILDFILVLFGLPPVFAAELPPVV